MKVDSIDIEATIEKAKTILREEEDISLQVKLMMDLLLVIISLLANRLNLNSKNSSKPPSSDPNRKKNKKDRNTDNRKPGGQKGHPGKTLEPVNNPDKIKKLLVDRSKLPVGDYHEVEHETRQVIDIKISRWVTSIRRKSLKTHLVIDTQQTSRMEWNVMSNTEKQ